EAKRKGSSNITGFSNPEADTLIEKQKTIFNVAERNEILRQIDGILCREVPYILLWNINYSRILYWNKFGTPPAVMSKYGQDSALALWWNDPDRADELREAMKSGTPLPQEPAQVRWE
ncbi:MAG: hypothetical protein J6S21_02895, partial [Victivallales bacterium]|nr:hypothetical protein [Victivallales bacterium]